MPPTSIDGTDITGATIDGTDVQEITVDGDTVFSAAPEIPASAVANYDATQEVSTGNITSITDRVGSFNLSGSATVVSNSINGKQAYDFDGTEEMATTAMSVSSEPFAVVLVFRSDNSSVDQRPFGTENTVDQFRVLLQFEAFAEYAGFRGSNQIKGGQVDTNPHVLSAKGFGTNQMNIRLDGVEIANGTAGSGFIDGFALSSSAFGQEFVGVIPEATVLESTTNSDIQSEEQRLAVKFGITL